MLGLEPPGVCSGLSKTHRHLVSCPIPALQRTLSPSPLRTSALAVSPTISPQLVQTSLALLGPSATPPGSLPQRPLLVLVSSLLIHASCMPAPVPGSGTDVAVSKTETDPVLWSWGLYPLCPVHPECFVHPLGGESEVWCSLYTVWSWASPFPSLASVVSIAAEGRGSMSCPGSLKGQAGEMERIAPTHAADSNTKLPSKWNR